MADAGNSDGASHLLPQITDEGNKSSVQAAIASAQAQAGKLDAARATVAQVTSPDDKAQAYSDIALAQAKAGDVDGTKQTLTGVAVDNSNDRERVIALCRTVEVIMKSGK